MNTEIYKSATQYLNCEGIKYFWDEQFQAIERSFDCLTKLETLFSDASFSQVIQSYQRMRNFWGYDFDLCNKDQKNEQMISGIVFDLKVTQRKECSLDLVQQTLELLETMIQAYFEYTSQYIHHRLTISKTPKKMLTEPEICDIASDFLHSYIFEFLTSTDVKILGISGIALHEFIRLKTRQMLSRKIKILVRNFSTVGSIKSEKPLKKKLESWQTVLTNISLPQFFYLVSMLTPRQRLCVLMKFGYFIGLTQSDFYADYQISENAFQKSLDTARHTFIDQIHQNGVENVFSLDSSESNDIVMNALFMEPRDLGRFTNQALLNENKNSQKLAVLLAEKGDTLLNIPLTHRQRELLTLLLEHFTSYQGAFMTITEIIHHTQLNPGTIYDELDRLYASLTQTELIFVTNSKNGLRKLRPEIDHHMFSIAQAYQNQSLDIAKLERHPSEKEVIQSFLQPLDRVYPNLQQIAHNTGLSIGSVRRRMESAYRILFDLEREKI